MRCLSPRTVSFHADGKTIAWSQKDHSREYAPFKLPCGKCLECRLSYARENAIRCIHEAKMYLDNCFITLTYSDENLKSPRLQYRDFQLFMKKLREEFVLYPFQRISYFVTGEYGDKTKRPHWHAILFNWQPRDMETLRRNDRGDVIYSSRTLDRLWGFNDPEVKPNEIGSVTLDSAGYVARYASKKLAHGHDGTHAYDPVHKRSTRPGIGKAFFEKYWRDMFNYGYVVLPDGSKAPIPRYYEKLLKAQNPQAYLRYLESVKLPRAYEAELKYDEEEHKRAVLNDRRNYSKGGLISKAKVKKIIVEKNFRRLQEARQGD